MAPRDGHRRGLADTKERADMPKGIPGSTPPCSVDGCDRQAAARGWCKMHHKRWLRRGDPTIVLQVVGATAEQRFWPKVQMTETCWLWTGALTPTGYGSFKGCGSAHRFAYELLVGPVPQGLSLDHLCRVRRCVNPDHLEPVTHLENVRRGYWGKQYCKRGHRYCCRACERERSEQRRREDPA